MTPSATTFHLFPEWEESHHVFDKHGGCCCHPFVGALCPREGAAQCQGCGVCIDGLVPVEMGRPGVGLTVIHNVLDPAPVLDISDGVEFTANYKQKTKGV